MQLVINLGLKSIRAIIFDEAGKRISTAARKVNSRLVGDKVEQDATEWQAKMHQVMQEVSDSMDYQSAIRTVTVSCSASCLVGVDKNLVPVTPVIMVSDRRASEQAQALAMQPEMQRLATRYGYSATMYSQLARIRWMMKNAPEEHAKVHKYLAPNDFLIMILTGGLFKTDTLNAEKFFYETDDKRYPSELLARIGVSEDLLPDCVDIGTNLGPMPESVCSTFKIKGRPDVVVSTYDAICSVFGTGASESGQICDVSGTVTSVRMYSDKKFVDPKSRIMCQSFPPSNGYLIGGSNNLGGGLIEWAKACFYKNEDNPYEQMQSDASFEGKQSKSNAGLLFLPNLLGARAPSWDADARGAFFGLERHHNRSDMMRSIFESIGFEIRSFLDIFEESGVSLQMVTASGGLARIAIANEIKASITGLPYHYMDEMESTSLGAAIIVMCATGQYATYGEACSDIIATRQVFMPRKADKNYYEDMYGLYKELGAEMGPLFQARKALVHKHQSKHFETIENL